MMIECALSVLKSLNHQDISRVIIPFARVFLSSYIVSQCKSTEPRLGFRCPLCRVYTLSDGEPDKPEKWTKRFPINDII